MWEEQIEPQGMALLRLHGHGRRRTREALEKLQSFKCTAEHLLPEAIGGSDDLSNLAAACKSCNNARKQESVENWQAVIASRQRELDQGTDKVPRFDDTWADERYLFKWDHVLDIEAPMHEVKLFAVALEGALKPFGYSHVRKSVSVVYPTFDGDLSEDARRYHFANRRIIEGTRVLLESADHARAVAEHFSDRLVRFGSDGTFAPIA